MAMLWFHAVEQRASNQNQIFAMTVDKTKILPSLCVPQYFLNLLVRVLSRFITLSQSILQSTVQVHANLKFLECYCFGSVMLAGDTCYVPWLVPRGLFWTNHSHDFQEFPSQWRMSVGRITDSVPKTHRLSWKCTDFVSWHITIYIIVVKLDQYWLDMRKIKTNCTQTNEILAWIWLWVNTLLGRVYIGPLTSRAM